MQYKIKFNQPFCSGGELTNLTNVIGKGKFSGDGDYTKASQLALQQHFPESHVLLTTSCTDALELISLLINIQPGDEIIVPSYSFVSTVNPFLLRGAIPIFADSNAQNPNIDAAQLHRLITPKTRAVVIVHYAGISCDLNVLLALCKEYGIFLIEDAAQCIGASAGSSNLGTFGTFGALSFHETKNIHCGEGGALIINDNRFLEQASVHWEKGTNRKAFIQGEVDRYGWVSLGSSFLPSELNAAFLVEQLSHVNAVNTKRLTLWNRYNMLLKSISAYQEHFDLPYVPVYAKHNGHIFYLVCKNKRLRDGLIMYLKRYAVQACFHYQALHHSSFYLRHYPPVNLPNSEHYANGLVRLPLHFYMSLDDVDTVCGLVEEFFKYEI